jgi:TetR/AcrR family transcriptional repressor of nem operon
VIAEAVSLYLSAQHRDSTEGCPYPAMMSEIARGTPDVRLAFARAFDLRVRAFAAHTAGVGAISPRERALATLALMVGGLLFARASKGDPISEEILAACRKWALPESDIL